MKVIKVLTVVLFITAIAVLLCMLYLFNEKQQEISALKEEIANLQEETDDLQTTFDSTEDLVKAIRSTPTQYADKTVTVIGTFYVNDGRKGVFDLPENEEVSDFIGVRLRYFINQSGIDTVFKNGSVSSVLKTGDYIKITGVVAINSDEFYLENCDYEMVTLREDR